MSLPQVDAVLHVWQSRLSLMAANLLELQCNVTFQSLTGTGGLEEIRLTGATAREVQPKLASMRSLFARYGLLQSVIERAQSLRVGLPSMFGTAERLRALECLLFTRCIEVETSEVPFAERQLLSASTRTVRVSADELLQAMSRTFAEVRDAVACVERAWTEFTQRADAIEREVERFRKAHLQGDAAAPALEKVNVRFWGAKAIAVSDPFSALIELRQRIEPEVARISNQLSSSGAHR